jgi:hypothetical protein
MDPLCCVNCSIKKTFFKRTWAYYLILIFMIELNCILLFVLIIIDILDIIVVWNLIK